MSFVKKICGPDEKLVGVATIHWIYGLIGLTWLLGLALGGGFADHFIVGFFSAYQGNNGMIAIDLIANSIFWISLALGVMLFILYFVSMISAEIGLTDKRVIYKRGLIFIDVKEVDIEEIKSVEVDNGIFGRILNYGHVSLDSRFMDTINIPAVAAPYRFVKALNEMRSELHSDSLNVVINQQPSGEVAVDKKTPKPAQKQKPESSGHKLYDHRYDTLGSDPFKALNEIVYETEEALAHYTPEVSQAKRETQNKQSHDSKPAEATPLPVPEPEQKKPGLISRMPMIFDKKLLGRLVKDSFARKA